MLANKESKVGFWARVRLDLRIDKWALLHWKVFLAYQQGY
jgi:hypothetical protein